MTEATAAARRDDADSDDVLMTRVRAGDAMAFRVLVEGHVGPLHRIAYRMIGDATEAEDLAQEALLRLWRDAARWHACHDGVLAGCRLGSGPIDLRGAI